jgi:acyl carrier protein
MVALNDMNRDELFAWVADLLAEMFELDRAALTPASNLYADLDIDSIDAVDLAVQLKQQTGKRLQPEVFKTIRTIGDVVDALVGLGQAAPDARPEAQAA